MDLAI
jgi:hypothetical protein